MYLCRVQAKTANIVIRAFVLIFFKKNIMHCIPRAFAAILDQTAGCQTPAEILGELVWAKTQTKRISA
jgi:hypothetical protein